MTQENPFPLVHGKSLANACKPPLDLDLPDFRFVPVQEGMVVLVPVAMFKEETPRSGSLEQVRAVRRFLSEGTVVAFRHGLAHWSFAWESRGDGNYVICHNAAGKCLTLHQEQADAIHIVTFAIVDVLYDRCLRNL
jgi:hypothetical protein